MKHYLYTGHMKTAFANRLGFVIRKAEDASSLIIVDDNGEKNEIPLNSSDDILPIVEEYKVAAFVCHTLEAQLMIELAERNIEIIGGTRGKTDDIIKAYLSGELESDDFTLECTGGNCNGDCTRCH